MNGRGVISPLPTHEEVLVCKNTTTTEEVGNLIFRLHLFSFTYCAITIIISRIYELLSFLDHSIPGYTVVAAGHL